PRGIQPPRGIVGEGTYRLRLGAHRHQHAAHVRVTDDRHRLTPARGIATLHAIMGIGTRLLQRALGDRHALQAYAEPGIVHHGEHVFDAAALLADQPADGASGVAIGHDAGGAGVDAQLVLDRGDAQVVAFAQRTVRLRQELRHDEERDALYPWRRIRRAGEHHVHDVVGEIVLAIGDKNLLAGDPVMVAIADRPRPHRTDVRPRLRLSQV